MFSHKVRPKSSTLNKTLVGLLLVNLNLLSGPLASAASWKFADLSTPADPHGACIIYVDDSEGKTDLRLQIARAKGAVGPAEVFLIETKQPSAARTWIMSTLSNQTLGLAQLTASATDRTFWHLPVNTQLIVNHMLNDKSVTITATGVTKELKTTFSKSNFSKALNEIQTRCLGGRALVDTDYETAFLKTVAVSGDLQNKTPAQLVRLRELYHSGFQTYLEQGANNQKINQVVARYKTTLDEYTMVTSRIQVLTQTEIPSLQNGINAQKSNRTSAEIELKRVTAAIPGLGATVVRDQGVLDRANATRAPYEAENNRLATILGSAQDNLRNAQNHLARVRNDIAITNQRLNESQNELGNLRNNMSNLQWRIRQSEDELRQARMNRDRFDANSEIRRRTDGNPRIQQVRNEVQNAQNQVNALQGQESNAQMELGRAQNALAQCQATAGADCSSQAAEVQNAQTAYYQINGQYQAAQQQVQSSQQELQRMISQIENEVRNEESRLNRQVDIAVDELDQNRREMDRAQYRIRDLELSVIPGLQRDLRNMDIDLRNAQNDVASSQTTVRSAEVDLESYRRRVDWAGKTAAIRNAADTLSRSTTARDDAYENKADQEKIISDSNVNQRDLEATLAARTTELAQLRSRQLALQPTVDRYKTERAPFDLEAARLNRLFAGYQSEYKSVVEAP